MDGFAYADIIFFALLAAYILNRLRATLGRDEGTQTHHFTSSSTDKSENVTSFPGLQSEKDDKKQVELRPREIAEPDISDKTLKKNINAIKAKDSSFNLGAFVEGANTAFEMIIKAFAESDRETLKMLLDTDLYKEFDKELKKREKANEIEEAILVSTIASEVASVVLKNSIAAITINFKSEQISLVKDKDGNVIEGNPSLSDIVEDSWTFQRDITSDNPNWTITAIDGD